MAVTAFIKRNKWRKATSAIVASARLTAQAAAVAATTIFAVPVGQGGVYEVSYSSTVTGAGAVSSTLGGSTGFQVKFTDAVDSVVKTSVAPVVSSAGNTTGTAISGVHYANCKAGTNLQYLIGYTDGGTTPMQFDLAISVKAL